MKAYEALAAQLVHLGVTDAFGLMGDGNLKLIPTLTHTHGPLGTRRPPSPWPTDTLAAAVGSASAR